LRTINSMLLLLQEMTDDGWMTINSMLLLQEMTEDGWMRTGDLVEIEDN
jgi:hypothetical protein